LGSDQPERPLVQGTCSYPRLDNGWRTRPHLLGLAGSGTFLRQRAPFGWRLRDDFQLARRTRLHRTRALCSTFPSLLVPVNAGYLCS